MKTWTFGPFDCPLFIIRAMDLSMTKVRGIASRLRDKLLDLKNGVDRPLSVTKI